MQGRSDGSGSKSKRICFALRVSLNRGQLDQLNGGSGVCFTLESIRMQFAVNLRDLRGGVVVAAGWHEIR